MTETIVRIASRGEGVTPSGRHVALTAPGDEVLESGDAIAGPHRQVPPCRHFPACGGCQLQHVDDAAYAAFLVDRIAGALHAQDLTCAEIRPPHLSPPRTRRRATLHFSNPRGKLAIGFKAERSHDIVDMRECHVLLPQLLALVEPLRRLLRGRGAAGQVSMTLVDQGIDVTISGASFHGLSGLNTLTAFAAEHRLARLALDDGYGAEARWEPEPATISLGGAAVPFPPGGFLQATSDGEVALVTGVRDAVGDARIIADLFAGLGTFALALPTRVHAVEGARDAALALKSAAARVGRSVSVEHRDLFRRPLTRDELTRFDAVVLDPPRAGAKEQAAELARSAVPRIAFVSCNPGTFARDAKTLVEGGYRLLWTQPVGQFRWSTHVELIGVFDRG